MEINTLINALGGTFGAASFFKVSPPAVSQWKKTGLPELRVFQLRERRPDLFKDATPQATTREMQVSDVVDKAENRADTVSDQPITIVTSPVTTESRDTNPAAGFSTPPPAEAY